MTNETKLFSTKLFKGESLKIDTGHAENFVELLFIGINQYHELQVSFKLSPNVMVQKLEKKQPRKVRTL
jgi:hypothetical protein